jgi:uncharacterized cysteine cluster protein YcgN (CxxCxxCC family)
VPDCLTIYPNWGKKFLWLPTTCAYRLLSENKPLFDWHPLISGDVNSVHLAGISVRGRTYRDDEIPQEEVYFVLNFMQATTPTTITQRFPLCPRHLG